MQHLAQIECLGCGELSFCHPSIIYRTIDKSTDMASRKLEGKLGRLSVKSEPPSGTCCGKHLPTKIASSSSVRLPPCLPGQRKKRLFRRVSHQQIGAILVEPPC